MESIRHIVCMSTQTIRILRNRSSITQQQAVCRLLQILICATV